jgi:hypothetical protein
MPRSLSSRLQVALTVLALALAPDPAAAVPDFVVTTPVFFFQIAGLSGDNPTITLQAGQTYEFQISTMPIHPFGLTTTAMGTTAFTAGVVGEVPTTSGTVFFTPPVQAADYSLFYTCNVHFFSGEIRVQVPAAPDADGDGVADDVDDCPSAANPLQEDTGGVGAGSPPDGIGDACQCGDVNGDGRVTITDATLIARSQLVPPTATLTRPELCDVAGPLGPQTCTLADAVVVRRAVIQPPTAAITQQCLPALPLGQ